MDKHKSTSQSSKGRRVITFSPPLITGRLVRRYKRFFAEIVLDDGTNITAHCPNTGKMTGLSDEGARCAVSFSDNPKRKLPYTLEMVEESRTASPSWVGINTHHPNKLVAQAILDGAFSELAGFKNLRREVPYGHNSRVDIVLDFDHGPSTYVEVKNVHLCRQLSLAEFPDARTERGEKHLRELTNMCQQGFRAALVYLVQRQDCTTLSLAKDIHPEYHAVSCAARQAGVEFYAITCHLDLEGIAIGPSVPVSF